MKKIFTYAGYALVIAAVIAVFTSTGKQQFNQYISDRLAPGSFVNLQVYEVPFKLFGAKLFSTYTATYYKPSGLTLQQQTATYSNPQTSAAVAALKATSGFVSERYLGIFNSFWKL